MDIIVDKITKTYGPQKAVDQLSFNVKTGEVLGFLGPNGAGKTTAIKILCGLSKPTSGEANIAGFDVYTQRDQIKNSIGY